MVLRLVRWWWWWCCCLFPPLAIVLPPVVVPPVTVVVPDTPCAYDRVGGVYFALPPSRALTEKIDNFVHRCAHADTEP